MFDMGFWELLVIGIVALLVIGPERLPTVAAQVGRWVGRARVYVNTVKADIDREIRSQELQDLMKQDELKGLADDVKNSINPPSSSTASNETDKNSS